MRGQRKDVYGSVEESGHGWKDGEELVSGR